MNIRANTYLSNALLSERHIQPGREDDIVLLLQRRGIRNVNVGEGQLPSEDFVQFGDGSEIERAAIVSDTVEIREEIQFLVQDGALPQLVQYLFAEGQRDQITAEQIIRLVSVV